MQKKCAYAIIKFMNIKQEIANCINYKLNDINFYDYIIESVSADKGDYSLPCFTFSKILRDNPTNIANNIMSTLNMGGIIERAEVVNGYLNFFLNKEYVAKSVLNNFKLSNFKSNEGAGKTVLIDYGSPNLAKFLHIGHLKTLIIGESLARLFSLYGYNVKRLNFIGDYGTPFGKIIGGMNKFGSLDEVKRLGNEALQNYYVKFNQAEAADPELSALARNIFKKIEDKDKEIYPIYQLIISIGLKEAKQMFNTLGVKFDDYRGEMYYNQFVGEVIKKLNSKHLLINSEDAKIVDLSSYDLTPAVIIKSDGTTLYITRDISAAIKRQQEYNFDKLIYVTDVAQVLHFKQLFKICELLGVKNAAGMEHVPYGRFSLPDGKISSRRGKQAVLLDLIEYAQNKAKEIIKDRTFSIEKPADVVNKVARAVLNYSVLKVERNKDCVFDMEKAFSFDGETAPYMQYTYTRLESILRKYQPTRALADYSCFDVDAFDLVKMINDFSSTLTISLQKRDTSIICKKLMDMCKTFNHFYTSIKILDDNPKTTKAKINLVKALKDTLSLGFNLVCIDSLKEM